MIENTLYKGFMTVGLFEYRGGIPSSIPVGITAIVSPYIELISIYGEQSRFSTLSRKKIRRADLQIKGCGNPA
jgi:hypothetical protein